MNTTLKAVFVLQVRDSRMSDFDERSGVVQCPTPWGCWWQTNQEVCVEITVPKGTVAKDIKVTFQPKSLRVTIKGQDVINVSPDCASSF